MAMILTMILMSGHESGDHSGDDGDNCDRFIYMTPVYLVEIK